MHFLKYITHILLIFLLISGNIVQANEGVCGSQSGEALYNCRVQQVCEEYKSEKPVYNPEDFEPVGSSQAAYHNQIVRSPALDNAKRLYRENMGNIYKCGLIQSQRNALEFVEKQIRQEASGQLADTIGNQITQRLQRLELSAGRIGCALTDTDTIHNKLNILRETTYEACKYTNYLEWVREYHKNPNNNLIDTNDVRTRIPNPEFSAILNSIEDDINAEISHTFQVFPLAYQAYAEYENHFPLHFMLTVLRGDYSILRDRLYEVLMPIAQLGYKVINAMSY
ncbi:hypothetical protein LAT59_03425 [Candidatus Gracilibacteria bacterium]|nr:hypothetical protein [Candidatus Gracilibacteria bacterium]